MAKFKVGDRVIAVEDTAWYQKGDTGTVHSWNEKDGDECFEVKFDIARECDGIWWAGRGRVKHLRTNPPSIRDFALRVIESGLLDAEACKVLASFALDYTGDDHV